MHEAANIANQETDQVSRWQRMANMTKRHLAPLAIAAAGLVPMAQAMESPTEALANERTHPVFKFRDYNQGDWGSRYAEAGCGPTAAAMVAATLMDNPRITPHKIGSFLTPDYWAHGSGTRPAGFHAVAERYDLGEEHSNLQEAKDTLRDGGLAIVHAKPGHFTSAGHYMVLKSLQHGRFRLADPNGAPGRDSEKRWWTPGQLKANGVDDVWTFIPSEMI